MGSAGKEPLLESSGRVPCCGPGRSGLAEGRWLGSLVLAEKPEEKGCGKEGETERGRARGRERGESERAAQRMLLMPAELALGKDDL